jgi:hypothetical protein
MNPTTVGAVVFALTFGGVLLGMQLRAALPKHHLDAESKDAIKVGIGLIATMSALVLGLVTASSKSAYDAVDAGVKQGAIQVLVLDRLLARYGPETAPIRKGLQQAVGDRIEMIWPTGSSRPAELDPLRSGAATRTEALTDAIRGLAPRDDTQRALQARAIDGAETLLQARWLALSGGEPSVPLPFLVVLVFWLTITFTSFGLFAPRNATVLAVMFVCAVSVASAIFLVLEMESPFNGVLKVSPEPLRQAYSHLNR